MDLVGGSDRGELGIGCYSGRRHYQWWHLGVNLGRRDVRVAEQLLDRPQVGVVPEQSNGKRVTERLWCHVGTQTRLARDLLEDEPEALPREAVASPIDEQRRLVTLANQGV